MWTPTARHSLGTIRLAGPRARFWSPPPTAPGRAPGRLSIRRGRRTRSRRPPGARRRRSGGASRVPVIVTDQHALTPRSRIPARRWAAPSARTAARASPRAAPVAEARGSTAGSGPASCRSRRGRTRGRRRRLHRGAARRCPLWVGHRGDGAEPRRTQRHCDTPRRAGATTPAHQRHGRRGRAQRETNAVANAASSAAANHIPPVSSGRARPRRIRAVTPCIAGVASCRS